MENAASRRWSIDVATLCVDGCQTHNRDGGAMDIWFVSFLFSDRRSILYFRLSFPKRQRVRRRRQWLLMQVMRAVLSDDRDDNKGGQFLLHCSVSFCFSPPRWPLTNAADIVRFNSALFDCWVQFGFRSLQWWLTLQLQSSRLSHSNKVSLFDPIILFCDCERTNSPSIFSHRDHIHCHREQIGNNRCYFAIVLKSF